MTKSYCKPATPINQSEIIEPEAWQFQDLKSQNPQGNYCIPVAKSPEVEHASI